MKKLFLLLAAGSLMMVGCSDEGSGTEPGGESGGAAKAPTSYTQKALLEYFSGTWCPFCPDGKVFFENIQGQVGEDFSSIVYHLNDDMDNTYDDAIDDKFANGYPSGMINRVGGEAGSRSGWEATTKAVLAETAKCGLGIDASSVSGDDLTIKVKLGVGAEDLPDGNYALTVALVEKVAVGEGTGWDQRNAYNATAGHRYQGAGDPIVGYEHTNVCRKIVTEALGDEVTAEQVAAGALSEFTFTTSIRGYDDDMVVVAFLSESTTNLANPAASTSYIHNVQTVAVGANKDFD